MQFYNRNNRLSACTKKNRPPPPGVCCVLWLFFVGVVIRTKVLLLLLFPGYFYVQKKRNQFMKYDYEVIHRGHKGNPTARTGGWCSSKRSRRRALIILSASSWVRRPARLLRPRTCPRNAHRNATEVVGADVGHARSGLHAARAATHAREPTKWAATLMCSVSSLSAASRGDQLQLLVLGGTRRWQSCEHTAPRGSVGHAKPRSAAPRVGPRSRAHTAISARARVGRHPPNEARANEHPPPA